MRKKPSIIKVLIICSTILMTSYHQATARQDERKVRIARLEIYSEYLEAYKAALAKHAKIAVEIEGGVLALQAVYDKEHPTQVTVFEIYASDNAYQTHLKTSHFLKYRMERLKW